MIKDICGIKLKGANFRSDTELSLFDCSKGLHRISILYGKNGAGKSTISKAFAKIKGSEENEISIAELYDKDTEKITLPNDELKRIEIFNEKYVDDNIRFSLDGLDTIVVIGKQKDVDDKITAETEVNTKVKTRYNSQKEKCDQYIDSLNHKAPKFYEDRLVTRLQGDDSWAGRDKYINEKRQNTRVNADTYQKFISRVPSKSRDELLIDFSKYKEKYEEAKSGVKKIEAPVKTNYEFSFDEETFLKLLAEKVEEPMLSEREKYLLSLVKHKGQQHLLGIKNYFSNKENKICPFCLQDVKSEYGDQLVGSIQKILSKASEEHQEKLRKFSREKLSIDFSIYYALGNDVVDKCKTSLDGFNDSIDVINTEISNKQNNVYLPINLLTINAMDKFANLIEELEGLEKNRIQFNAGATDTKSIKNELEKINSDIAYFGIIDTYKNYIAKIKEKNDEDAVLNAINKELQDSDKRLKALETEKSNVHIAMDAINDDLSYIFFAKNRLSLDYREGKYVLLSRGCSVTPDQISVGERNAIALCYFFSDIMKNQEEKQVYRKSYLLIVDDPVSSFDMENRVGILSYLKYELCKFITENKDTKALIMTHDLQTLFDCQKFSEEIVKLCDKKTSVSGNHKFSIKEICNLSLQNINPERRQEYTTLLENVYEYGLTGNVNYEISIGNMMRRVLEAYGTFCYKQGMAELSTDPEILNELDAPFNRYFENLMYRLVLNNESHFKEQVQTLNNINFFDFISTDEKKRTARDVICMMYKLSKLHLLKHLSKELDVEQIIESWCEDIISKSV